MAILALVLGLSLPVMADGLGISFAYGTGWSTVGCILIVQAAAFLSFFLYERSGQLLSSPWRLALFLFRFLVLLVLGLMLLEPKLEWQSKQSVPPMVVVLHDDSESMAIHADSNFVKGPYRKLLVDFHDKLATGDLKLRFSSFGEGMVDGSHPDSLDFRQPNTNLAEALNQTSSRYGNQNLGAVVLVSDGIPTSGTNPLYALDLFEQPIFSVLVGDTTPQRDVRISEVLYNEIAYLDNESPIKVKVNMTGFPKADLKATLYGNGKILGTQTLSLTDAQPSGEIDFVVKPSETGLQQYSIRIDPLQGELTTRNNSRNIFIKVLETRVKVALFAGSPHPDLGALRQCLERDGRFALKEYVHLRPNTFYEDPGQTDLKEVDLFLLHNFPLSAADMALMNKIKAEIEARKAPFMVFVGQNTHLPTLQSSLGSQMALFPNPQVNSFEEAQVNFKTEYKDHSTFTFDDEWIRLMNNAPPVVRNQSEWRAAGDAKVLATAKIKNIVVDYPVYALRSHLDRKNMVLVGENIWRIRQHAQVETGTFDAFDDWIYNNIQWLMVREDKRRFKVSTSKTLYSASEPVLFRGEAYDENYKPVTGVDVKVILKSPSGKEESLFLTEAGNARYFLEVNNLEEGNYSFVAEGKKNDVSIGTDRGVFSIGKSNIEHFHLTADRGLMEQIALRTGGKFVFARQMMDLADDILELKSLKPVVSYSAKRMRLHEMTWIFAVLGALLAIEWFVRKRFSLA
jgi:hypothetical protein